MIATRRPLLALLIAAILATALPGFLAAGPVFAPGTKLFVARTEHFDIIFPERSRPSAMRLYGLAESVYDEVAGKLAAGLPYRIPVAITPDIGSFDGYSQPFPYMHIVLYDTSLDIGWTAFRDNFRSLFLHELTHAVSLQIRAPWAAFLSGVFGSWVLPQFIDAPEFMVEGVTVSFESADGREGRASDPLVKERLRQDIYENRFKSPIEASGLYDEYPFSNVYYEYGGLFNAYLQKTYGMERYAGLWKAMGKFPSLASLDPYEVGFYRAFESCYGLPFGEAWAGFRNSLAVTGIVDAPAILGRGPAAYSDGRLASDGESLYWVDARVAKAMRMSLRTGATEALFDAGPDCAITAASDGGRLLVTRAISLPDGRDRIETLAFDLAAKRFLPDTVVQGMREAVSFRDGWVGIVSRLHYTDLVFASAGGTRVLLAGSDELAFSSPATVDDARIALIVAVGGIRKLGILDAGTGSLSLVRPEGADEGLFDYMRSLSASPTGEKPARIYFNYDSDDRFYKLGVLEAPSSGSWDGASLRVETADYSGGVFSPLEAGGTIYYLGRFSDGWKLCRYPEDALAAGGREIAFVLEAFDAKAPIALAAEEPEVEPYRPLAYVKPFGMWFPYFDLANVRSSFRPFGLFVLGDPIDANRVNLTLGYDSAYPFADAGLRWAGADLPVALSASLGDNLAYGSSGPPERQASASLGADLKLPLYPASRYAALGASAKALARWNGSSGSPYAWGYSGWNLTGSAYLGLKAKIPTYEASEWRGLDLVSYHDLDLATGTYKAELHLSAAYDDLPIWLDLWGAWASSPVLRLDATSRVFSGDRRPAYAEYASLRGGSSSLVAEGAAQYRLANQRIHSNILGLYFNRILVDLGLRGAYFSNEALFSAYARLSLDVGAAMGMVGPNLRAYCEGYARLSEADPAKALDWRIGIQVDADAMGGTSGIGGRE